LARGSTFSEAPWAKVIRPFRPTQAHALEAPMLLFWGGYLLFPDSSMGFADAQKEVDLTLSQSGQKVIGTEVAIPDDDFAGLEHWR